MEAGWLLALITVPLFFNVYSSRVFEPDKLALLRSLALAIAAAWLVKVLSEGGLRFEHLDASFKTVRGFLSFPLAAPVAALVISLLISTALSVTPRISLFGSYQRLQGTYTTLAYLVVFASVVANMRRRAQLQRLISVMIVTSLPVSLYGILQRFQLDPLPWGGDTVSRVSSTMGNPIFLGAYLILVIPVTFGRVVEAASGIVRQTATGARAIVRATIYVFIASMQLIALWMTVSRGPWLGFLAGSFFFFVLLTSYWHLRALTVGTVGLAAALGIFLIVLNIPGGPLEFLRDQPGIGRLGHVFETDQETGLVRVLIWQGTAQMMSPHPPLEYPDGRTDAFNAIRPLVGYGPEAMIVAFNRFYPPELGEVESRTATPDRSHNETWDSIATTGLIGLVAYLALFASVFYYGLKWLGLMQTPTQRNTFLALYAGGGVAGAVGLVVWRGLPFFGVGLPFGIMLGLILYLTVLALFMPGDSAARPDEWRAVLLISLIAAVMAHFVEIHFGIAVAASRTLFWACAGWMVVVGLNLLPVEQPESQPRKKTEGRRRRRTRAEEPAPWTGWLAPGLVLGALLCVAGFDFVNNPYHLTAVGAIVWQALTTLPQYGGVVSYAVLLIIGLTWLAGGLLVVAEAAGADAPEDLRGWALGGGTVLGAALAVGLAYWFWLAGIHAGITAQALNDEAALLRAIDRLNSLPTSLYVILLGIMLLAAFYLPEPTTLRRATGGAASLAAWLAVPLALAAVVTVYSTNLRVIQADIIYKTADGFGKSNNWEVATRLFLLASDYAPNEDYYYLFVGKGYLQVANQLTAPDEQVKLVQEAEQRLLAAQRLNPLNPDHTANLGRLYRWWASVATDAADRTARAQKSNEYYARVLTLSPNSALLWNEWGAVQLGLLDDPAGALDKINHSLQLDPGYGNTYSLLGDYHVSLARAAGDEATASAEYAAAVRSLCQGGRTGARGAQLAAGACHGVLDYRPSP